MASLPSSHAQTAGATLAWDPDTNPSVAGYRLHTGTSTGVYTQTIDVGIATAASVSNLVIGKTYYFVVTAYNNGSVESAPSNEISFVAGSVPTPTPTPSASPTATPTPASPTNLTAAAVSSSQINLSWIDNSNNETGFKVEQSTNGTTFSQIGTVGTNTTTYVSNGLTASTKYSYRIRAYNSVGNSSYSSTASATTAPSSTPTPTPTATPSPSPTPSPTPSATPIITVSASPTSVHEGGIATYTITTSVPSPTTPITVNYAMSGKAVYGTHYILSGSNGTVTIPAGASSANVNLRALITGLTSKSEKAIMTLQSSPDYKLPKSKSLKKVTVTIQNIYP